MTAHWREPHHAGRTRTGVAGKLDLQHYFPYRLAVLAEQVSLAVAEVYAARFALSRQQWRILAVLGSRAELPTKQIGRLASLDKMQVSRAMQALEGRGIVTRARDLQDKREWIVGLTASGRALYRRIVPFALAREAELLGALTRHEIEALEAIMRKLSLAASAMPARAAHPVLKA